MNDRGSWQHGIWEYLHNRSWLTFIVLKALGRGAAAPRVVRGLLAPVVPSIDVASKLYEHLDEVDVLYLGCMMKCSLVKFGCVHIGPWRTTAENVCHQEERVEPKGRLANTSPFVRAQKQSPPRKQNNRFHCIFSKFKINTFFLSK